MAMKLAAVAVALCAPAAGAIRVGQSALSNQSICLAQDRGTRALMQTKLAVFGVVCEEMCKKVGQYPNCQCPGFNGQPADEGDDRACMAKYCQDPKSPCPTEAFLGCVKDTTKVFLLQWAPLLQRVDASLGLGRPEPLLSRMPAVAATDCQAQDRGYRAFLQTKLAVFGVQCEEMCKTLGMYPNCQCPGFAGQPASEGDDRACFVKLCQDPKTPCPNDAFVTCVEETSKAALMQWSTLLQRFDADVGHWKSMVAANLTAKRAL